MLLAKKMSKARKIQETITKGIKGIKLLTTGAKGITTGVKAINRTKATVNRVKGIGRMSKKVVNACRKYGVNFKNIDKVLSR